MSQAHLLIEYRFVRGEVLGMKRGIGSVADGWPEAGSAPLE